MASSVAQQLRNLPSFLRGLESDDLEVELDDARVSVSIAPGALELRQLVQLLVEGELFR